MGKIITVKYDSEKYYSNIKVKTFISSYALRDKVKDLNLDELDDIISNEDSNLSLSDILKYDVIYCNISNRNNILSSLMHIGKKLDEFKNSNFLLIFWCDKRRINYIRTEPLLSNMSNSVLDIDAIDSEKNELSIKLLKTDNSFLGGIKYIRFEY